MPVNHEGQYGDTQPGSILVVDIVGMIREYPMTNHDNQRGASMFI